MAKRKTKEQHETEARAALRQRVQDIATGAAGFQFDADGEFATAEFLSRFIPALKVQFGTEEKAIPSNSHCWLLSNLHYFDNVDTATAFLYESGVRA